MSYFYGKLAEYLSDEAFQKMQKSAGESSSSGQGRCMKGGNTEAIKPKSGEEPPKSYSTEKVWTEIEYRYALVKGYEIPDRVREEFGDSTENTVEDDS